MTPRRVTLSTRPRLSRLSVVPSKAAKEVVLAKVPLSIRVMVPPRRVVVPLKVLALVKMAVLFPVFTRSMLPLMEPLKPAPLAAVVVPPVMVKRAWAPALVMVPPVPARLLALPRVPTDWLLPLRSRVPPFIWRVCVPPMALTKRVLAAPLSFTMPLFTVVAPV